MSIILLLLFLLCCNTPVLSTKNNDEIALLKIKKQLGDPPFLSSWVEGFDFCPKISSSPNGYIYVGCTNTSRVDGLVMRRLFDVTAPFPEAICGLTKLRILSIDQIPGLNGQIPSCINKLYNLYQVDISETSLSGRVPHFYNSPNLDVIILARNNLSHSIPPSLFTLPNLTSLNLSSNHLTGTIPKSFVNMWAIDVGNNQLHGDASFLFGKQSKAGVVVLANNSFKFDLSYVEFSNDLFKVDLSHNKIYGKVPDSFATAAGLWFPNLSFNRLCGKLPQGVRFGAAVFANNGCLCGYPLPPCSNSSPAPAPALSHA